jgi:hypothetical protein
MSGRHFSLPAVMPVHQPIPFCTWCAPACMATGHCLICCREALLVPIYYSCSAAPFPSIHRPTPSPLPLSLMQRCYTTVSSRHLWKVHCGRYGAGDLTSVLRAVFGSTHLTSCTGSLLFAISSYAQAVALSRRYTALAHTSALHSHCHAQLPTCPTDTPQTPPTYSRTSHRPTTCVQVRQSMHVDDTRVPLPQESRKQLEVRGISSFFMVAFQKLANRHAFKVRVLCLEIKRVDGISWEVLGVQ